MLSNIGKGPARKGDRLKSSSHTWRNCRKIRSAPGKRQMQRIRAYLDLKLLINKMAYPNEAHLKRIQQIVTARAWKRKRKHHSISRKPEAGTKRPTAKATEATAQNTKKPQASA